MRPCPYQLSWVCFGNMLLMKQQKEQQQSSCSQLPHVTAQPSHLKIQKHKLNYDQRLAR
jgi:hypothetical protein